MNRREVGKFMGPIPNHDLFFCGFHVAKKNPKFQVTTMHYCRMRGEGDHEMHQCLLYDSVSPGAKLPGVEYIVSDKVFRFLPDEEKKYWHPHTHEVLGGGLVASAMGEQAELDFMKYLLTTWGRNMAHLARSDDPSAAGRAAGDVGTDRRRPGGQGDGRRAG